MVEPTAVDRSRGDAVESDDVVGCEEGVEDEADHASYTMLCEDVHTIINTDPEFD